MYDRRPIALVLLVLTAIAGWAVLGSLGAADAQAEVTIEVGDFWFCDSSFEEGVCQTVVDAGDTVVWEFGSSINSHTVTHCGASCDNPTSSPLFDSGTTAPGGSYSHTFNDAGTFLYACEIHPTLMFGRIVVQSSSGPAPQTPSSVEPGDIIPPGSTPLGGLPTSGQGPSDGASSPWWLAVAVLAGGALLALLGATGYRRTR